jgi:Putative beta barrel porin-7 (BBP7)
MNVPDLHFFLRVTSIAADLPITTLTLDPSSENLTMKMKKLLVTLLALGLYTQEAPAQTNSHFSTGSATRKLSDDGDSNRYVSTASSAPSADMSILAPTAYSQSMESSGCSSGGCGCGDYSGYSCCVPACGGASTRGWLTAEQLFVFAQDRTSPVMATTAAQNVFPLQGAPGVTDRFGGTLTSDMIPGYRLSGGRYFGPDKKVGIGARGYGIYNNSESFTAGPGGGQSIGVPFYNLARGSATQQVVPGSTSFGNDAYIVQGNTPGGAPISTGSLVAAETLQMVGGELSGYLLLARSGSFRTDLVAGYTYNQLRNRISLNTTSTNQFTGDAIANGTVLTTSDDFRADNKFNGAHLGVLSSVVRNRVNFSTLAKVSFGNMRSRIGVTGSNTVDGTPGVGGIFAQASNIGTTITDRFAFLPEMGLKMGYSIRPNIQLSVGYTLLVWSDVVLAGEQMDRTINLTGLGDRPGPLNKHSSFWMQSVDAGLNFVY